MTLLNTLSADGSTPFYIMLKPTYVLDEQIGYKLRLVQQRHLEYFSTRLPEITPTQFSVMVRLHTEGALSQNHLGRLVHTDAATTKGVVDRLIDRGWLCSTPSTVDRRRLNISLTARGEEFIKYAIMMAGTISSETLKPLNSVEQRQLLALLDRLIKPNNEPKPSGVTP